MDLNAVASLIFDSKQQEATDWVSSRQAVASRLGLKEMRAGKPLLLSESVMNINNNFSVTLVINGWLSKSIGLDKNNPRMVRFLLHVLAGT